MKLLKVTLVVAAAALLFAQADSALQRAIRKETLEGDLKGAIDQYKKLAQGKDRAVAAKALVRMGQCYDKLGDAEARKAYERVVREFGDQKESVEEARKFLAAKGGRAETGIVARQVWAGPDNRKYRRAISRDGRYIAFDYGGDGHKIFLQDLLTGKEQLVRASPPGGKEHFYGPVISPDGKQIAYGNRKGGTLSSKLYVSGADGSNPRQLEGLDNAYLLGWSPDGRHVLARLKTQAVLVSVDDGSSKVIASQVTWGRFSPDGRYIAFVRTPKAGSSEFGEISLFAVDSGREIPLVDGRNKDPLWTPDGKKLLFLGDSRNGNALWSIRVVDGKGEGPPELVKEGIDTLLGVSQEGDYYYQTESITKDLYVAEVDPRTGKLASRPKQITSRYLNEGAAWSPDGEHLAYCSRRGADQPLVLVLRSAKTGDERVLTPKSPLLDLTVEKPQWFPDGRSLLVHSTDGKLRQLDVRTGEYRPLLESETICPGRSNYVPKYDARLILAADGRAIYYASYDRAANLGTVLRRDLADGAEKEVCRLSGPVEGLSISPDGSRLAFVGETSADAKKWRWVLMTVAASGGQPKQLLESGVWIHDPMWSKDGQRLFFIDPAPTSRSDIMSIPAEGGEPQPLGIAMHSLFFLSMHPDGRQIVFADDEWRNPLWVMKNLFGEAKAAR